MPKETFRLFWQPLTFQGQLTGWNGGLTVWLVTYSKIHLVFRVLRLVSVSFVEQRVTCSMEIITWWNIAWEVTCFRDCTKVFEAQDRGQRKIDLIFHSKVDGHRSNWAAEVVMWGPKYRLNLTVHKSWSERSWNKNRLNVDGPQIEIDRLKISK